MAGLSACAAAPTMTRAVQPPTVTSLVLRKSARRLLLVHEDTELERFDVALGRNPVGAKEREGDGKTPEGAYYITHLNPNSRYHLSIGISYPNTDDVARAQASGVRPGGNIFIHGQPVGVPRNAHIKGDWTAGCIAVSNAEIERIYALVRPGTPIFLQA